MELKKDIVHSQRAAPLVDIRKFDPYEDAKHVAEWLRERGLSAEGSTNLPELGLIAYKTGCPIAVGFLRKVEGGYAILDSLVTNPAILPKIRDTTINLLVKDLISLAKESKIKGITATTIDLNTLVRAQRLGFVKQLHTTITLTLS